MEPAMLIASVGLGLAYSAAPGVVNTESLRRGLERGFRPALLVQVGALVGDLAWAAVALVGIGLFLQDRSVQVILGVAGACFLLRLAWSALQRAWRGGLPGAPGQVGRGDFATGMVFSLANPFGLAFWTGVGGGMAVTGGAEPGLADGLLFLGGFISGAGLWCLIAATAVSWGRQLLGPGLVRWIGAFSGLALGYFGLRLLWETVMTVMERPGAGAGLLRRATEFAMGAREARKMAAAT
jgi:chemosensory pili system protein ChpE